MHAPRSYEKWMLYRDFIYWDKKMGRRCIRDDAPEECRRSFDLWWNMNYNPWYDDKEWFPDYPNKVKRHRKKGRFLDDNSE